MSIYQKCKPNFEPPPIWDDLNYPPRDVQGFYTKDELQLLVQRRTTQLDLSTVPIKKEIVDRYYQEESIRRVTERLNLSYRRALMVMATGTGKTRTVVALIDLLMRANWVKRVLFLADRTTLVRQAVKAFKAHLPDANAVNLLEEKEVQENRVVVSTYHTIMNQIDDVDSRGLIYQTPTRRFGVGHFDLIVIDEAHRSVYRKFKAIFDYFDGYLFGLTATPKDDVDHNTYHLFGLEDGVPTYNYDLDVAVADEYLVPPNPVTVPLKFIERGIHYDDLSDEEQEEWDLIEWDESGNVPDSVDSAAINRWLFNEDTVDKVLATLMEHGQKVAGGDRLGKTIIFAKNHRHAEFIQERFDANYPHLAGHFARVIDNYQTYAESLIDDFSKKDADPYIAISVDMLDTGVDVPEVVNLVFFKLVRSKTKFFQMLGRGTRLCPDLFGVGQDKESFNIFDVCQNFEFFNYNPRGIVTRAQQPLSQRIFNTRLDLVAALTKYQVDNPEQNELIKNMVDALHAYVVAMPLDNFLVRPQRKYLDPFLDRERWNNLSQADVSDLTNHVSGLPSQLSGDPETAKRFDLLILQLQRAHHENQERLVETWRNKVIETANRLQDKHTIPAVRERMDLIHEVQTDIYWQAVTLPRLEELRISLREITRFIERESQRIIVTDFVDELGVIQETDIPYVTGGVNVAQYRKKVEQFLRSHNNHIVIQKIRRARQLTPLDLSELERFFFEADETGSREEFEQAYGPQENLGDFIRRLVGLDRRAAKELFNRYLDDKTCTADQIHLVNYIINYLTRNGVMDPNLLYDRPFTDFSDNGLDGVFDDEQANQIVCILEEINDSAVALAA
ncbi:DEAD/DEAH box helicase family protein [Chloroflexi bacterium TSY]|nr:DEAD/DEAH box helicase family protein [Chloroflexi bacterium TSY]